MSLLDTPVSRAAWAAVDFEGTGSAPGQADEPVQVGMATMDGADGAPGDFFRSYIRPASPVTRAAQAVHRITDEQLHGAPPIASLWPEFKSRLTGAVLVAHGAGTERRFLRVFPLHGFGPWVDTLAMSRAILPELPDHSLGTVAAALQVEPTVRSLCPGADWHDALFDAVACLVVLRELINACSLGDARVGQLSSLDAAAYHRRRGMIRAARGAGWAEGSGG
jgi:DNA polymerase III subunit epsilon